MSRPSPRLQAMIDTAEAAAEGLRTDFGDPARVRITEKGPSDFVSSADLRSQETIRAALSRAFPDHALFMEEGDAPLETRSAGRLIVDPLDGTTNFLRGVPHFAIAIALEEAGVVTAGVVLDVPKRELFRAELGQGAWLGDTRLRCASTTDLGFAVIGTGIPHRGRADHAAYLAKLARVMPEVAGIRRIGAAALDLAYVAAGRFDAFFEWGLSPWDVAAGSLLVTEAGGVVTKSDGSPADIAGRDVLASGTAAMHEHLRRMLGE